MLLSFTQKKAFVSLLVLILLLANQDQSLAQPASANEHAKLLIVGDSLSAAYGLQQDQGWVSLLQKQWQHEQLGIEVINAAISGETTDGGLARLPRLLAQHKPTHVLVELGGNDALQGHNITKIRDNLNAMIELIERSGAQAILQDMQIPTNYGSRYRRMFEAVYRQVAEQQEIPLLPFFLLDIALKPDLMQRDGIHPTAKAQPLISKFMYQQLTPLLRK